MEKTPMKFSLEGTNDSKPRDQEGEREKKRLGD
jgi:hypothetical protein